MISQDSVEVMEPNVEMLDSLWPVLLDLNQDNSGSPTPKKLNITIRKVWFTEQRL